MKLDISNIKFSTFDLKRGLKLPNSMNNQLAEDIGIMIGDGHIGYNKYAAGVDYILSVSGNASSDKDYILNYIKDLKLKLYGLEFRDFLKGNRKTEIQLKICSRGLLEFYTKTIGLPLGKKINIGIPDCIWSKKEYLASCLRGIIDTDFALCFKKREKYPVLQLKTCSQKLVIDCKKAFQRFDIKSNIYCNIKETHSVTKREFTTNYLFVNGRVNLRRYLYEIGFSNKRILDIIEKNGPTGIRTQDLSVTSVKASALTIRAERSSQAEL